MTDRNDETGGEGDRTTARGTSDSWYDVTDFGADGDDDAAAIQRAVDAAREDGGGTVFLPAGEYRVSEAITVRPGVRIVGAGMGATAVVAEGEGFAAFEGFGRVEEPIADLGFADLAIDCSELGGEGYDTGEKCVYLQYVRRCRISGVYAHGAPATGIGTDFMVESVVHGCIAERNGRFWEPGRIGANGIGIGAGRYEAGTVVVSDCHALENGNNGVMFEAQGPSDEDVHSGLMKAVGCSAVGNRIGFRDSADRRVTFLGCSAAGNDESGIVVSGKDDVSFGAREHRVADCHLVDNAGDGVRVMDASAPALAVADCTVADNDGCGVRVDAGRPVGGVSVAGSSVHGNGECGVLHRGGGRDVAVTDCAVHDNDEGIRLDAAGGAYRELALIGNRCYSSEVSQHRGISIVGPHEGSVVLGNVLDGNAGAVGYDERPEVLRDNVGYPTEAGGRTTAADGDAIEHGLAEEPSTVTVQSASPSRAFPREVDGDRIVVGLVDAAGERSEDAEPLFWEATVY